MKTIEPETGKIWKFKNGKLEREILEFSSKIEPEEVIKSFGFELSLQSAEDYMSLSIDIYIKKGSSLYSDSQFLVKVSAEGMLELILASSFPDFIELMSKLAPLGTLFNTTDIREFTECTWKTLTQEDER